MTDETRGEAASATGCAGASAGSPPGLAWGMRRGDGAAALILSSLIVVAVVLGHDDRRIAQIIVLALPGLAVLLWPLANPVLRGLRAVGVALWTLTFVADGLVRGYLERVHQAAPDSAMIMSAMASSNARESGEYLTMYAPSVAWLGCAFALASLLAGIGAWRSFHAAAPAHTFHWRSLPRWLIALSGVAAVLATAANLTPAWRELNPVAYWANWSHDVLALRASWSDQSEMRRQSRMAAEAAKPLAADGGPATVVLVLTESINRDNLALYGYARDTSPRLDAARRREADRMVVLRNGWSVNASTVPAVHNMMSFGTPAEERPLHILALAQAAGYKVTWISNQDDLAVEQAHARFADTIVMLNHKPGRRTASLDEVVIAPFAAALRDPAPKKLIVVHLMGAHPHYSYRYPKNDNPFVGRDDAVRQDLVQQGRSRYILDYRDAYDGAVRYNDLISGELFERLTAGGEVGAGYRAMLFISDHGQEVGHSKDHAGHSVRSAAGYRIPVIVWQNRARASLTADVVGRPFRNDWTAWTLAHLLGITWTGFERSRDVLDPQYVWVQPEARFPGARFITP